MRRLRLALVLFPAFAHIGCASDEAIRRVRLGDERPPSTCRFVAPVKATGEDRDDAKQALRKAAAREGADYVRVEQTKNEWNPVHAQIAPWSFGNVLVMRGDAFACGQPHEASGGE